MTKPSNAVMKKNSFSSYQIFIIVGLACLLFTIVLDYMLLPALSATLLDELALSTEEFGLIASVYAISAGISALLASGFADQFDRKSFLLFFYSGFLAGLMLCALAPSFEWLLAARIVTGAFGGVVASICFAIITDLFRLDQRGRVMGFLQMASAAALILGLPLALYLAASFSWQVSYWIALSLGGLTIILISIRMKPLGGQASTASSTPWQHLYQSVIQWKYWTVFSNNILIVGGDVIFMTFNAAYMVNNLNLTEDQLPLVYGAMGLTTLICGPLFGKLADRFGKLRIFIAGTVVALIAVMAYAHLSASSILVVVLLHVIMFVGVNARMVSSSSLSTAIPTPSDRGAFMAIDSSLQQLAGGLAAVTAGLIISQSIDGEILNYPMIGWVVVVLMLSSIFMMHTINNLVWREEISSK